MCCVSCIAIPIGIWIWFNLVNKIYFEIFIEVSFNFYLNSYNFF